MAFCNPQSASICTRLLTTSRLSGNRATVLSTLLRSARKGVQLGRHSQVYGWVVTERRNEYVQSIPAIDHIDLYAGWQAQEFVCACGMLGRMRGYLRGHTRVHTGYRRQDSQLGHIAQTLRHWPHTVPPQGP